MTPIDYSARQPLPYTFRELPPLQPWTGRPMVPPPILGQRLELPVFVLPPLTLSPPRAFEIITAAQTVPPKDLVENRHWSIETKGLPFYARPNLELTFTAPALSFRDPIKPANYQELRFTPSFELADLDVPLKNEPWYQSSLESLQNSMRRIPLSPPRPIFSAEERLFAQNPAAFFWGQLHLTSHAPHKPFSVRNLNHDFHQAHPKHQSISPKERVAVLGADGNIESYPLLDALSTSAELKAVMVPDPCSAKTCVVNSVVGLFHTAQRGLSQIGLEIMEIGPRERAGLLEALQKSQQQALFILQESMRQRTIISPQRPIARTPFESRSDRILPAPHSNTKNRDLASYGPTPQPNRWGNQMIDYLESYDFMRFDPNHLLGAASIDDLVPKMGAFLSNMVIRGEKGYHSFSESLEAKNGDLIRLFKKVATIDKSGIIASFLFNGINVMEKEFGQYVDLRSKSFGGEVLTIGAYNKTYGLNWDFFHRIPKEFEGMENFSTEQMRNQLVFASKACDLLGPDYYCTFELHSEATLQYFNAFAKLGPAQKELASKHILVIALGAIRPIPKNFGFRVSNIYSRDDKAFKNYGKSYLDNPEYEIEVVDSLVPRKEQPYVIGDHAYLGETYKVHSRRAQNDLDENLKYIRIKE